MSKGKLHKITINPETHCLKLRFAQHPSESDERVIKKFLCSYFLSDHNLKEFSEVCQGGVPDLISANGNLCIWLEPPKPRDFSKYQQEYDFQLLLEVKNIPSNLLQANSWTIEKTGDDLFNCNGIEFFAVLNNLS